MKNQATKTPRSNSLVNVDFAALESVPAYLRKGVTVTDNGQVITAKGFHRFEVIQTHQVQGGGDSVALWADC